MSTDTPTAAEKPLRSIHTQNFPDLLAQIGGSLVVSTYQAGKLIVVRADGDTLNTHFRVFSKPMGLATDTSRLAIGTSSQIWIAHNVPAAAPKLEPVCKHDACYIPRHIHTTGDIDIHEMGLGKDGLWFVNTRFSCLCTLDLDHSFVPRWRPPFVSAYAPEDRCHLNGLGMVEGQPKYVTALGQADTPGGWRENKANGGLLMDITDNRMIATGLSMPHSPRWYRNQLWVLESGRGSLARVDMQTGQLTTVASLPGFTRGLSFYGPLAFIGLSQVRETATFGSIPITEQLTERTCGVWVVNIETGETVAFLKFEDAVQEIFAVELLAGARFPEVINEENEFFKTSYILPEEALAEVAFSAVPLDNPDTFFRLGNQAYEQGDMTLAADHYRRCLNLQPTATRARYNLGITLTELENWTEAEAAFKQVIAEQPDHGAAYNTLGLTLLRQNRLSDAADAFKEAITLQPDFAMAHMNLGMALLAQGDLPGGFAAYEWRWKTAGFTPLQSTNPLWDGSDLTDKTILIHTEQGAGDAIQFMRFIPQVIAKAKRVVMVAPASLTRLFKQIPGLSGCLTDGTLPNNAFDTYAPLMSLPGLLGTTLDTIPVKTPYIQATGDGRSLPATDATLKVGLAWAGHPNHSCDRTRSLALETLYPLFSIASVSFYSLQKGPQKADLNDLPQPHSIHNLSEDSQDWMDTANAVAQLDLVITVDTGVAHLAAAMGKPTWILLSYAPDWRWMLDREDSPWYPSVQLFRQTMPGDWGTVVKTVTEKLSSAVASLASP